MAALSQTRSNVHSYVGAVTREGVAGETIDPGTAVYLKAADGKYWTATNTSAAAAEVIGISVTGAAVDTPVLIQTSGEIDVGATTAVGTAYFLGAADEIVLETDLGSTDYVTFIGVANSTAGIHINILVSGVPIP